MPSIGKLDRQVEIQEAVTSRDSHGQIQITGWTTLATVWAEIKPSANPAAQQSGRTGVITIRHYPGLTASHRILYGSRVLNLLDVVDVEEAGRWHQCPYHEDV